MYIDQTLRYRVFHPGTFSHKLDLLQTQDRIISARLKKKGFPQPQEETIVEKVAQFIISRRMKHLIECNYTQSKIDTSSVNVIFE